jgi:hypothetical protein
MGDGPDGFYHLRDVHKTTISGAVADGGRSGEVRQLGIFANRADVVRNMVERLEQRRGRQLRFCYEAGPCGYGLHRLLTGPGHACTVVAPSLIPIKEGDRVKTDRRDAMSLDLPHAGTRQPEAVRSAGGGAAERTRHCLEGAGSVVQSVATACGQWEAEGCRYDRDRTRDGRVYLGHRPSGSAAGSLTIKSNSIRPAEGHPTIVTLPGAYGGRQGNRRESSRPVMSRPVPTLVPRTRQPETESRSCGNQPAHESLLTGVFSLCLLPCASDCLEFNSAKAGDERPRLRS